MGTASTTASLAEALGMALPGTPGAPPCTPTACAREATGRKAVALARSGLTPRQIITALSAGGEAFVCSVPSADPSV